MEKQSILITASISFSTVEPLIKFLIANDFSVEASQNGTIWTIIAHKSGPGQEKA